jgi:methylmalonyl-CoA/ethylmalonyl-CoA epimerase
MTQDKKSAIKLPPVEQVGIVVKDLDKAMEFYCNTFGMGPFQVMDVSLKGCIYRGRPTDCRMKLAMARSGPIEIELIQVLEGETPHTEFLREKGEGLHHLRFSVDDLNAVLAQWAGEGIEPVWQHSMPEVGISWAYLNTDAVGGVMVELIEMKEVGTV